MRAKRRALSKDEVKIRSDEIRQRLFGVERVKQAKTICTFISAFKEPDTVEIIKELWEQGKKVILVPGLAFDRNGGRMGFGKGYYDRLLESSNAVKIGLCYDFQILEKIPTESHDVPMNFVITEKEILLKSSVFRYAATDTVIPALDFTSNSNIV